MERVDAFGVPFGKFEPRFGLSPRAYFDFVGWVRDNAPSPSFVSSYIKIIGLYIFRHS